MPIHTIIRSQHNSIYKQIYPCKLIAPRDRNSHTWDLYMQPYASIWSNRINFPMIRSILSIFIQPKKYGSHTPNLYLKCMLEFMQKSQKIIITISIFKRPGCIRKMKQTHRIYSYIKLRVSNSHFTILIEPTIVLSSTMSLTKKNF